jgi:hypothetical protein
MAIPDLTIEFYAFTPLRDIGRNDTAVGALLPDIDAGT